jgi:hypothetical protein
MRVCRFNVTPIKGTRLHHPSTIRFEPFGVPGNRLFFLLDEEGQRISAAKLSHLARVVASHHEETLRLDFPDGGTVEASALPGDESFVTDMWGREVRVHTVPGPLADALSDYLGRTVLLGRCDREGDGNDERAVTVMSRASVDQLGQQAGYDGALDGRRFRMTLEIEGCGPHEEDTWRGRHLRVGAATLRIDQPVPRCIVTTWDPDTGEKDFPTLRRIHEYRGRIDDALCFGVYAEVVEPGDAQVGDEVALID